MTQDVMELQERCEHMNIQKELQPGKAAALSQSGREG